MQISKLCRVTLLYYMGQIFEISVLFRSSSISGKTFVAVIKISIYRVPTLRLIIKSTQIKANMKTTTTSLIIFLCLSFGAGQGSAEECGCGCGPNSKVDLMVYTSSLGSGSSCDEADEFSNNEFVAELFDNSDCLGEPIQRKNFNMTHSNSYPSFMIKIDDYKLWSARVTGDNVVEDCTGGFIPKLFGSSSIRVNVIMQSSSSSSELTWYITAEKDYYASSDFLFFPLVLVLDEPRREDCDIDDYDCNFSWCSHREYSDNSYMPCIVTLRMEDMETMKVFLRKVFLATKLSIKQGSTCPQCISKTMVQIPLVNPVTQI